LTATTGERNAAITHRIGSRGTLVLRTVRGSVRVRAIDGDEARVEARYALPGGSHAQADPENDGVLRVSRHPDELRVEADDVGGMLNALGTVLRGGPPRIDFDISLPREASLRLSGVSATLEVVGLRGDQEIRTVSGDVSLDDVEGQITLQSVSGDALVNGGSVALRATTTSGDLSGHAGRFESARIRSVSGDVSLTGAFDTGPEHSVETISGDLELAPANGVTVSMTSVSGSIHSELPHRRDSSRGRRTLIVGDGHASMTFRTMSGDLSVVRPSHGHDGDGTERSSRSAVPAAAADAPAAAAISRSRDPLEILRALERGELDVETAARLLEDANDA
jgi:hypothetical protein